MKKIIAGLISLLLVTVSANAVSANVAPRVLSNSVSASGMILTADQFPGIGNYWNFTLTKIDQFKPGEWVDLTLIDSAGNRLASDFEYISSTSTAQPSLSFRMAIYSGLTRQVISAGVIARVELDPADFRLPKVVTDLVLPTSFFPAPPARDADYVKFSQTSYSFEKKSGCNYQSVDLKISDPYSEVKSVNVSLQTNSGKEIESDTVQIDRELGINFASLFLCTADFANYAGKQKLVLTVQWADPTKAPLSATVVGTIESLSKEARVAVSKLKNFCVKGSTYRAASGTKCPAGFKPATFKEPTVVQWNSLSRNPAGSKGANFLVFACIAQFDSVTGPGAFRAYSTRGESNSYYSGTNSFFKGDTKQLLAYSEDDVIVARVTVLGKYNYRTFGGGTAVPQFQIRDIKKVGTC
jgi:hypothetical protein